MSDQKNRFLIKKGTMSLRPKFSSKEEMAVQSDLAASEMTSTHTQKDVEKAEVFDIDGIRFKTREPKIIKRHLSLNFPCEIFSAKYCPDDNKIGLSMLDGSVMLVSTREFDKNCTYMVNQFCPVTSFLWKSSKNFLVGDTEGRIYDLEYQKNTNEISLLERYEDKSEQVLTMDYSPDIGVIAYAGKSMKITLISDQPKKELKVFESGDSYTVGHTNRIFSVKFSDTNPNLFMSAGWDGTLFFWDVRNNKSVGSVFGPIMSGDSLDVKDNLILSGSYRDKDPLELFDLRTFKLVCNIDWTLNKSSVNYISSCKFSRNKSGSDLIIVGSCLSNNVSIFKKDIVYEHEVSLTGIKKGVYSVGFSYQDTKFFYGSSDGEFKVFHYFGL